MHLIKFYFDNYSCTTETCVVYLKEDELEDTKGVIGFRISKNRPHNTMARRKSTKGQMSPMRFIYKLSPFTDITKRYTKNITVSKYLLSQRRVKA